MRSLEAEYFLRVARVGSVVLAAGVAGYFVLRAQQQEAPPPLVEERVPLILLENATVSESAEEIERAPEFVGSTNPAAEGVRNVLADEPLVAPTVRVDLPAAAPLSTESLLAPGSPILDLPVTSMSSSELTEAPNAEAEPSEPKTKKPSKRKP